MGRNPRFMQDPQSDQGAVAEMRQAIREGRATVVEVINVRKDGSRFWNQVGFVMRCGCCVGRLIRLSAVGLSVTIFSVTALGGVQA